MNFASLQFLDKIMTILTSIFCPHISSFNLEEPISCVIACYPLLFLFLLAITFDLLVSRFRPNSSHNREHSSKNQVKVTNVETKSVSKLHRDYEVLSSDISAKEEFIQSSNKRPSVSSKSTIAISNAPNQESIISNHSTSKSNINRNLDSSSNLLTATSHSTIAPSSSTNLNPLAKLPVTLFICTKCRRQPSCVTVNTNSENTTEIEDIVSLTPVSPSKQQKSIKFSSSRTSKVENESDSVSTLDAISTSTVDQAKYIDQSSINGDSNATSSTANVGTIASSSSHPSRDPNTFDMSTSQNGSLVPNDKSAPSVTSNVESTKTVQVHHSRVNVEIETKKSGQVLFDRIHEFVSATSEPQNGLRSHNFINDNTQDEESQGGSESDELSRILRNYLKIGKLQIQPVQCLSTCAQANVVALSHPLRYTYQFGSLHESNPTHITDLLAFTKFYVEDENGLGFSKTKTRPGVLKKGLLSRVPPLTGCLEIQNVGNLKKFGTEKAEDDSSGKLRLPSNNGSENISARNRSRSLSFSNSGGVSKEFKVLGNICECGKEKIY